MKKIYLKGQGKEWSYTKVPDDEAQRIADAFMAGETFSILINADNNKPTYRVYFNSFQLVYFSVHEDEG